jgi:hypothetical protein
MKIRYASTVAHFRQDDGNIMVRDGNSFVILLVATFLASWLGLSSVRVCAQEFTGGGGTFETVKATPVVIHPAPDGAMLSCVPAFSPNQSVWATVVGSQGQPLSGVSLLVNNEPHDTNVNGQVTFVAPNTGAVALSLKNNAGAEILHTDYVLLSNGLLSTPQAGELVRRLVPTAAPCDPPVLDYAPVLVEPGQSIVVLGQGFTAESRSDRVIIDGISCNSLSGSPVSILARIPDNLGLGPLKTLFVSTKGGVTADAETDVARAELQASETAANKGKISGRIAVTGTLLPALVQFHGPTDKAAVVTTTNGEVIEDGSDILMPGGAVNFQSIDITGKQKQLAGISVQLVPDVPQLAKPGLVASSWMNSLLSSDYSTLLRLRRREIGVATKLSELAAAPVPGESAELDKSKTQGQALALRRRALASAVAQRRAILLADGGSEQLYKQAMDDAAGGAYYVLESKVRDAALAPEKLVLQPPAQAPALSAAVAAIFIPEVHFKLWPPPIESSSAPATSQPAVSAPVASQAPAMQASQVPAAGNATHKTALPVKTESASKRVSSNTAKTGKAAVSSTTHRRRRHRRRS